MVYSRVDRCFFRHGKLEEAFHGDYQHYRLRVIGHSLGAGCAAILSILLRPQYPDLRCLAFSPPGCVLSLNLVEESTRWTTSYILDADIVPRLSIEAFEGLRNSLLEMICRIKIPKYQVLSYRRKGFKNLSRLSESVTNTLCRKEEIKESKFKQQVDAFYEFQASEKSKNISHYIKMGIPGRIIQLYRIQSWSAFSQVSFSLPGSFESTERKNSRYAARWAKQEDFQNAIISSHLLTDHDPIAVKVELQNLAHAQFGLTPPYYTVLTENGV